jgi:hypothetical protein
MGIARQNGSQPPRRDYVKPTQTMPIDTVPEAERRAAGRTATVFRPVLIETEEFAGFCLVRNLSMHGLMGDVYTSFADEQPVAIHFGHVGEIYGSLKWCREGRIGVQFDAPINVDDVLVTLGSRTIPGLINRAPRLQIRCAAELTIGERIRSAEVEDISQRGLRVRAPFMQPNQEVGIQIDGLESRRAIVRWAQAGTAGLNFFRPLSFEQLAQWAVQQQARSSHAAEDVPTRPPVDFARGWEVKITS